MGYSLEPPRRGGSNEYPQSMFLSRNKINNIYPCRPQFYYINVGYKGSKLYRHVFVMDMLLVLHWKDYFCKLLRHDEHDPCSKFEYNLDLKFYNLILTNE